MGEEEEGRPGPLSPIRLPSSEVLETLFERAPEVITITDREGRQSMVNTAGLRLLGFDESFRRPPDGWAFVHPDDRDRLVAHRQLLNSLLERGEPQDTAPAIRYRVRAGSGEWRWLEMVVADLSDVAEVGGRVAFSRDVTEAEERGQALLESEARLAALVGSFQGGALLDDADGTVLLANNRIGELFDVDLPVGQIIGRPVAQVLAALEAGLAASTPIASAFAIDQTTPGEVELATRSGRDLSVQIVPIRNDDDGYGRLWLVHDATARREADRRNRVLLELEQQARRTAELHAEQLTAYDQLRNDFVAGVSHELRTPLTAIASAAELLRDDDEAVSPAARARLAIIERNADRLRDMVEDLLLVGRLDAGVLTIEPRAVSLAVVADEISAAFTPAAAARDVTIRSCIEDELALWADPHRLHEVVGNLVENAVKFTTAGTEVVITGERLDDDVTITVRDHGPGVPVGQRDAVFGRFVRTPEADRSATPGSGLGLSIVKGLVELHGGTVGIEDAAGGGAVLTVALPAAAPEEPA